MGFLDSIKSLFGKKPAEEQKTEQVEPTPEVMTPEENPSEEVKMEGAGEDNSSDTEGEM